MESARNGGAALTDAGNVIALASARVQRAEVKHPHPADDLSFMEKRAPAGTGINYWKVESTGGYVSDCKMGRELAREYLAYIGQYPTNIDATLLGSIVRDMLVRNHDTGRLGGIEIAFLAGVNEAALQWSAGHP